MTHPPTKEIDIQPIWKYGMDLGSTCTLMDHITLANTRMGSEMAMDSLETSKMKVNIGDNMCKDIGMAKEKWK